MYGIFIILHLLVTILLVIVVLFQQPQKGGMASVFGGGESIFGGGGAAPFMAKLTSGLAIVFMITSLTLVLLSAQRARGRAPIPARRVEERIPETPTEPIEPTAPSPAGGK
uniref:Protein-export membrane protein SecG n=1 Tax=candidate division WOR-3 bacterium TaxID=2052148 RepID=A0A7C6A9T8_UNCW3